LGVGRAAGWKGLGAPTRSQAAGSAAPVSKAGAAVLGAPSPCSLSKRGRGRRAHSQTNSSCLAAVVVAPVAPTRAGPANRAEVRVVEVAEVLQSAPTAPPCAAHARTRRRSRRSGSQSRRFYRVRTPSVFPPPPDPLTPARAMRGTLGRSTRRGYRAATRYSLHEDAAGNASSRSDYLPLRGLRTTRDDLIDLARLA
jgi:hypothetical protein